MTFSILSQDAAPLGSGQSFINLKRSTAVDS